MSDFEEFLENLELPVSEHYYYNIFSNSESDADEPIVNELSKSLKLLSIEDKPRDTHIENKMNINATVILNVVPEFDGNPKTLNRYLANCQVMYDSVTPFEYNLLLRLFKTRLTGKAFDLIYRKDREINTWDDLKTELKLQFSDSRTFDYVQIQLVSANQQNNETVLEFGNRIEELYTDLIKIGVARDGENSRRTLETVFSKSALTAFEEGLLQDECKTLIKASRFETLREAIAKACESEKIHSDRKNLLNIQCNPNKSPLKCQICAKLGHSALKCNQRFNQSRINTSPQNPIANNVLSRSNVTCSYCRKSGHHISQCYLKQNSDQRRSQNSGIKSETSTVNFAASADENSSLAASIDSEPSTSEPKNLLAPEHSGSSSVRAQTLK